MTVSSKQLLRAIGGSRVAIFNQDCDYRYLWVENPSAQTLPADCVGRTDSEIFPAAAARAIVKKKSEVLSSGQSQVFQQAAKFENKMRTFEFCVHADRDADGSVTGLTGSVTDISRERQQAQSMAKLILEVSHRSRNLLAILQSIAAHTAASEDTIEGYRQRFAGRLQSLSRTQDIITSTDWQGAEVDRLVEAQLAGLTIGTEIAIDCSEALLLPSPALHLGLAIYELATLHSNTSSPVDGRMISIEFRHDEAERPSCFQWRERWNGGAEPIGDFTRSILERAAPQAVDGEAVLNLSESAAEYTLQLHNSAFRPVNL